MKGIVITKHALRFFGGCTLEKQRLLSNPRAPEWRNWYTHETQNLARSHSCRFESDLRHSRTNGQVVYFSDLPVVIEVFAFCLSRMSRTALHVAHTLSHK